MLGGEFRVESRRPRPRQPESRRAHRNARAATATHGQSSSLRISPDLAADALLPSTAGRARIEQPRGEALAAGRALDQPAKLRLVRFAESGEQFVLDCDILFCETEPAQVDGVVETPSAAGLPARLVVGVPFGAATRRRVVRRGELGHVEHALSLSSAQEFPG